MIKVEQLQKSFGKVQAIKNISFAVEPGEIVGLLGPNGAGKTTCMRIICGLVKATSGTVHVGEFDVGQQAQQVQNQLGVLPDGGGLYSRLTARENIAYFGRLRGMSKLAIDQRMDELVEVLHMGDIIDRKTLGFSHGETTKVALARAIIHNPAYILLDEPTNGLDVLTTKAVRHLLLQLKQEGKCIIFSSHLMHEVNNLCDRAIIVAKGCVAAGGKLQELLALSNSDNFEDAFVKLAYRDEAVNA